MDDGGCFGAIGFAVVIFFLMQWIMRFAAFAWIASLFSCS